MRIYKFTFNSKPKKGLYGLGILLIVAHTKKQAIGMAKDDWNGWIFSEQIQNIYCMCQAPTILARLHHIE